MLVHIYYYQRGHWFNIQFAALEIETARIDSNFAQFVNSSFEIPFCKEMQIYIDTVDSVVVYYSNEKECKPKCATPNGRVKKKNKKKKKLNEKYYIHQNKIN